MAYTYGTEEWENAYQAMVKERLATTSKPYIMGTPEWIDAFEKAIQGDDLYKEVAKEWEGSCVIHMLANSDLGFEDDIFIFMDLWHGECRFVKPVPRETGENGEYVLTGEFERWQSIMAKELDVLKAMMQGKIKLKGDLPSIVRSVKAASRLVDLASDLDTKFPAQMSEEEMEEFKVNIKKMREEFGV